MGKVEQFIQKNTKNYSNMLQCFDGDCNPQIIYKPWLTPDQARSAVEIAREETIKDVCEWLYNHNDYICGGTNGNVMYDMNNLIKDLKKYFEDKL